MEHYHQVIPESLCEALRSRVSGFLGRLVSVDWDKPFEAPLDTPVEPVTDWVE